MIFAYVLVILIIIVLGLILSILVIKLESLISFFYDFFNHWK